ncbi:uncharacterized protein LOC110098501 [Dendrobium catenatum]|uniref:uncharacterized protein LOC110098501 n=1 Tax=Dendrobium catenatum TaxID=906689 RepID=UPI0009F17208|nr:uncharacterized protein LOC110098501 [Dendrobium catenatum]
MVGNYHAKLENVEMVAAKRNFIKSQNVEVILYEEFWTSQLTVLEAVVICNNTDEINSILKALHSQFALKQLGQVSLFLGIQVLRNGANFFLNQSHYASKLLRDSGFEHCKAASTPLAPSHKLTPDLTPFSDPYLYRRLAGSLQYLSITQPDIAYATNRVCQQMQHPTVQDFQSLKRLLCYIKGTLSFGLPIHTGPLQLQNYTDADWASDAQDRKSISGYCTFLGPNLITWTVKKQVTVAKSSTEAEYRALSAATSEAI